jgi:hypothetical protein
LIAWVERILRALRREMQTPIVREQVDKLVAIRTWNRRGESFEFAHFTDRQLARAIDKLDQRARKPTRDELIELVAQFRASGKNLKPLIKMSGKPELADELWPPLERKLDRALAKRTETRIPAVPVIDEATRMAQEYGRADIAVGAGPETERPRMDDCNIGRVAVLQIDTLYGAARALRRGQS